VSHGIAERFQIRAEGQSTSAVNEISPQWQAPSICIWLLSRWSMIWTTGRLRSGKAPGAGLARFCALTDARSSLRGTIHINELIAAVRVRRLMAESTAPEHRLEGTSASTPAFIWWTDRISCRASTLRRHTLP